MSTTMNISMKQGKTLNRVCNFAVAGVALDVSADSFAGQVRTYFNSATVVYNFTFDLTLATTGVIAFGLTDVQMATLKPGTVYVYDVEWTKADGTVLEIASGTLKVKPEVTKAVA